MSGKLLDTRLRDRGGIELLEMTISITPKTCKIQDTDIIYRENPYVARLRLIDGIGQTGRKFDL